MLISSQGQTTRELPCGPKRSFVSYSYRINLIENHTQDLIGLVEQLQYKINSNLLSFLCKSLGND